MTELIFIFVSIFMYGLGLMIGERMGENHVKRVILYHLFDYRDETVGDMFDEILDLTAEDWMYVDWKKLGKPK